MSYAYGVEPVRPPRVVSSARAAWDAFKRNPFAYSFAGLLFFLITGSVPIIGALLGGPLWVGLCNMGLVSLRGEEATLEHFFAPFGDKRLGASLVLGGIIAVINLVSSLLGTGLIVTSMLGAMSAAQLGDFVIGTAVGSMTLGLLIMLLPLLFIAYYLFPAGYYIANGETDGMRAIRRSIRMVSTRRTFWAAFWASMTLGHLVGFLCCCVGLCPVLGWNAIAIVHATAQIDPPVELPDHA